MGVSGSLPDLPDSTQSRAAAVESLSGSSLSCFAGQLPVRSEPDTVTEKGRANSVATGGTDMCEKIRNAGFMGIAHDPLLCLWKQRMTSCCAVGAFRCADWTTQHVSVPPSTCEPLTFAFCALRALYGHGLAR